MTSDTAISLEIIKQKLNQWPELVFGSKLSVLDSILLLFKSELSAANALFCDLTFEFVNFFLRNSPQLHEKAIRIILLFSQKCTESKRIIQP